MDEDAVGGQAPVHDAVLDQRSHPVADLPAGRQSYRARDACFTAKGLRQRPRRRVLQDEACLILVLVGH
eukprot:3940844-Rhodomonas_salina.10